MSERLITRRRQSKRNIIPLSAEESRNLMSAGFKKGEDHFFDREIEGKVYTLYGEYLKPNSFRVDKTIPTDKSPEKKREIKNHVWSA